MSMFMTSQPQQKDPVTGRGTGDRAVLWAVTYGYPSQ